MSVNANEVSNDRCSKLEEENSRLRDLIHNVSVTEPTNTHGFPRIVNIFVPLVYPNPYM